MSKASTKSNPIENIINELEKDTPRAQRLRSTLVSQIGNDVAAKIQRKRAHSHKLYIAAHIGRPFKVSGVMVNRLALDLMNLQDPKYGETYVKCVGYAKVETTRGIDAFMYTAEGVRRVREEIPKALENGLIKTVAHPQAAHRTTRAA